MNMKMFKSRRFKHGSLATVITVGFIVAIVLINVIVTMLLQRFPLSIDLTKDKRFQLTKESVDFVKKIDSDVKITVCEEEAALNQSSDTKQALEIIKNYSKYSNKIKVDFVNLTKDPNFAKKHPDESFAQRDIFFESDGKTNKINVSDLFDRKQTQQGGEILSSKAEQAITTSLMKVTDKNPANVSLLTGLDNVDVSPYKNLLVSNTYQVVEQNIMTEEINKDTDIVILPQPAVDLSADVVKKLENFLDNDGQFNKSLVFIASQNVEVGPVLKTFLAQWGIEVGSETIIEMNDRNLLFSSRNMILNQIGDEEFAKQLKSQQLPIITANARPIKALFETSENRSTKVLVKSYESSIIVPKTADEKFDLGAQPQSEFNTMVLGSRNKYEGTTLHQSNVLAFSQSFMAEVQQVQFLNYPGFLNSNLIMTATNNIAGKKDTIQILPIQLNEETLVITQGQVKIIGAIFIALIPILVIIAGIVVWVRRRHL